MVLSQVRERSAAGPLRIGTVELDDREITALARAALADPMASVTDWTAEPVDYAYSSPTTEDLIRVRGSARRAGELVAWSVFVKLLRAYRHWPLFSVLPPELQERAALGREWRYEADVYESDLGAMLPCGLRLPQVYRFLELGDDRVALVLEDVSTTEAPWDLSRFRRAAELLGRLAARLTRADCLPRTAFRVPGELTRLGYAGRVLPVALPALADDALWTSGPLTGDPSLRTDSAELARRLPALLDALARLPQLMVHGDASPQNLLVPVSAPDTFVAIDWTLGGLAAVGDDLGQLLIGLAHTGQLGVAALEEIHDPLVEAYVCGLAEEGVDVDEATVRYGMDGGLAVRSAFTALPIEGVHDPGQDGAEHLSARVQLMRYLVDLGLKLPLGGYPAAARW